MTAQRIIQNASAKLRLEVTDGDGTLADPSPATATIAVARADGTAVVASTAATRVSAGVFTYTLATSATATLDELVATWTAGDGTVRVTSHPVAARWYWSLAEARASQDDLGDRSRYADTDVLASRLEVEDELEAITARAFVPRYARVSVNGSGSDTLILPTIKDLRAVRSVRAYPFAGSATYTVLSASELASIVFNHGTDLAAGDGTIRRTDVGYFPAGARNIVVEVEYGRTQLPADLRQATLERLRSRLNRPMNAIPDRATSMTTQNGETFRLDTPDAYSTGIPEIDALYGRYSARFRGKVAAPASRTMRLNVSSGSLWHR